MFTNVPPPLLCIRIDVCSAWTLEFLLHSQLFSSKSMQQRLNYFLTIPLFYSIFQFSKLRGSSSTEGQCLSALQKQILYSFFAIHPFTSGDIFQMFQQHKRHLLQLSSYKTTILKRMWRRWLDERGIKIDKKLLNQVFNRMISTQGQASILFQGSFCPKGWVSHRKHLSQSEN